MSVFAPLLFKSTDSGANTLAGVAGGLLTVLNDCLICRNVFTSTNLAGSTGIVDNTTKARSQSTGANAGTWLPFQTATPGAATDACFIGMTSKFGRAKFSLSTLGTSVAGFTVEYWNGSAWVAVTGLTDGTTGLTASGTMTWTIPSDWATTALNGITCYWLRLRYTSYGVMPIAQYCTVTGWTQKYGPTTNEIAYQQGGGTLFFLDVEDNSTSNSQGGTGAPTARDARVYAYETMTAVKTGTQMTPVTGTISVWRKSSTADATTRPWIVVADDRTVQLYVLAADTNLPYTAGYAGDFYSMLPVDPYRFIVCTNVAETAGALSAATQLFAILSANNVAQTGKYLIRNYLGLGVPAAACIMGDSRLAGNASSWSGSTQYPNGPDGGLWVVPILIGETTLVNIRGRLRGLYLPAHAITNFTDGDTISGQNAYVGKTFLLIKPAGGSIVGVHVVETSDTWDTN